MKKLIGLFSFALFSTAIFAQEEGTITLNAFGGYTLKERVPFDYADIDVKDGFQYGGSLEYYLSPASSVELKYNRMDTEFSTNSIISNAQLPNIKSSLNFILLGGNYYLAESRNQKAVPFIGGALGLGIIDGPEISSSSHFSWDLKAGVKIKTSGPVSVKLQAYLQSMVSTYGYDYYWSWWGPVYLSDYHRVLQFGLGGVLSYDLNNHNRERSE